MKSKTWNVTKYTVKDKEYTIIDSNAHKTCIGSDYNFCLNKETGFFARWGKTKEDDPIIAPFPEICDMEITTICHGIPNKNGIKTPCSFCYKSNTPTGINMSFDTFKTIFDKLPKSIGQIAFGGDSECKSNPDIWSMMQYCRDNHVIPNITVANIDDETATNLKKYCGAVAVSRYDNKNICYDSVKRLTDKGMKQINIHILVSEESYDQVMETLNDKLTDERLSKLNAIVLLNLKKCGRGSTFNTLSKEKFRNIIDVAFANNITIGFDSCGCSKFLETVKDYENYKQLELVSEKCESSIFSCYISADGFYYPCSFSENVCKSNLDWTSGINMLLCNDFIKDVWNNNKTVTFREELLKNDRNCPLYEV